MYRCLDVRLNLLDKPDVFRYELKTWDDVISILRMSINSKFHFVYVSKVGKKFISAFHDLSRTTKSFDQCVTCCESLNNDLENLWINFKYGDIKECFNA